MAAYKPKDKHRIHTYIPDIIYWDAKKKMTEERIGTFSDLLVILLKKYLQMPVKS